NLDGPFDHITHVVDVRRPSSILGPGRHDIPSVGLFAWRLRAYPVTHCQADCLEEWGPHRYTFSALGNDSQLFTLPAEDPHPGPAGPLDVPTPITRRALEERLPEDPQRQPPLQSIASGDYYGLGKSLALWVPNWPVKGAPQPVPRERIIPADLSGWRYQVPRDHIAVDPELGRFAFPARQLPRGSV